MCFNDEAGSQWVIAKFYFFFNSHNHQDIDHSAPCQAFPLTGVNVLLISIQWHFSVPTLNAEDYESKSKTSAVNYLREHFELMFFQEKIAEKKENWG